MAVTRSWTAAAPAKIAKRTPAPGPGMVWIVAASLLVAAGIFMAYAGKAQAFAGAERLINVNTVASADELAPLAGSAAPELFAFLERKRPLANIGALSPLRRSTGLPLARLKPSLAVRTAAEFRLALAESAALFFAGFYVVAFVWRLARFGGDRALLPALHLLAGIGFIVMIGMRDPLRDTLEFHKFALGVFLGCLLLALPALRAFDYMRLGDWCYVPLFAAVALFGLLLKFGRGPAGNDAKVNLGPFQPVELIKILLVLFLAGYFTRNWERLRDLREKRLLPKLFGRFGMPRLQHLVPVLCAVAVAVLFFFELKDLGPALVTFFVFLAMFGVARGRPGLVIAGIVLMVAAVTVGYRMGQPHTVVDRIHMWLSPWDNDVRGGDQLAHALWAFSTGGPAGSGPGWGDTSMIPAGNTDLVLPAIGEEWGFLGVVSVFLLLAFLVDRALRAAARCQTQFGFFLATGLGCLIASEMMLITAGVLGVLPLSGVVSPFLSSGNTAMIANFLIFAMIASVSADEDQEEESAGVRAAGMRPLRAVLSCAALVLLAFAAKYQVFQDREYLARDAHSFELDGVKRPQHNPRLNSIAHEIPRGTIYDRNGIPVATSDWAELERHRKDYEALGIQIEQVCSRFESRHYPFGAALAEVVGDLRTGENFHATNASLVEHDANRKLQGYEYAELAGLVRYRHEPGNPALAHVLARDRNVQLTLDARLELKVRQILDGRAGAVVVMDAATGDVLAMASGPDDGMDRARYGLYPPGSTFKLVTAMAALRKDPDLKHRTFLCRRLPDGRAGNWIAGWNRPIKDDIGDRAHGTLDMGRAIAVSCNAYFAQLGVRDVGPAALAETAERLGIETGDPREFRKLLPWSSYGQGTVLTTPFKMARVAAAIADGGRMPEGRWTSDSSNMRTDAPAEVLPPTEAAFLAASMRRVVTEGTGRQAMAGAAISFAGKTGTAQLDQGQPHAWFAGFAPYDGGGRRLAFAVVVEHGGYGALAAAPVARRAMEAAKELGLF